MVLIFCFRSFVLSLWLLIFNLLCHGPGVVSNIAPPGYRFRHRISHEARVENVGGGAMTKDEPNPLRNA